MREEHLDTIRKEQKSSLVHSMPQEADGGMFLRGHGPGDEDSDSIAWFKSLTIYGEFFLQLIFF